MITESPDIAAARWTLGAAIADAKSDIAAAIKEQCRREDITDPDEAVRRFIAAPMPKFVQVEVAIGSDDYDPDITAEIGGESGL